MLRQGPLADLRSNRIDRAKTRVVVAMRHYPRGLRRELVDEYRPELAPDPELFRAFRAAKEAAAGDHDAAFAAVRYEERFRLTVIGAAELERLARAARAGDVILLCQCSPEEHCHRDLLLLMASAWWGAPVSPPRFPLPLFRDRLEAGDLLRPPE